MGRPKNYGIIELASSELEIRCNAERPVFLSTPPAHRMYVQNLFATLSFFYRDQERQIRLVQENERILPTARRDRQSTSDPTTLSLHHQIASLPPPLRHKAICQGDLDMRSNRQTRPSWWLRLDTICVERFNSGVAALSFFTKTANTLGFDLSISSAIASLTNKRLDNLAAP